MSSNSISNRKVTLVSMPTLLALSIIAFSNLPLGVNSLFGFGSGDAELKVPKHDKYGCVAWRQTTGCQPDGPREPKKDKTCMSVIAGNQSGYCECAWGRVEMEGCRRRDRLQCAQSCMTEFPAGDVDGEGDMAWIAGSKWHWNNWREVEFKADGAFMAATPDCQQGQCSWSVHEDVPRTVLIQWGDAGMHTVVVSADDSKMAGQRFDGDKCTATLNSKGADDGADVYSVLGVTATATDSEIKKAFRAKSKKLHPDLYRGDDKAKADVQFNQVREAYEVLKDPDSRVLYDTGGMEAVEKLRTVRQREESGGGRRQQMGGFGGFFGNGGEQEKDESLGGLKGATSRRPFEVTLQQLYEGKTIQVKLERRVVCRGCKRKTKENAERCGKCNKCPDEIEMVLKRMGGFMVQAQERVASKEKCVNEGVLLKLVLEQGMPDGHELKFERMGEQSPGKIPGDMIFQLQTKEHAVYTRKGNDLHTTLRITLKEALAGFSRKLPRVNAAPGKFILIETKPGDVVKPMEKRSVSGEGMPVHGVPSTSGKLVVEFEIDMPNQITDDQRKVLMQVL